MNAILSGMAAILLASTIASATSAHSAETVNFGIISTESQQNLRNKWEPFIADMEKETGLDIEPFFASDYAGVIEGMRFGKVQMGWFGNKSAMEAVDRAKGEVFAQTVPESGEAGYYGLILAPKDSALTSVDDLLKCDKSVNFGLGDPNSTSGYLVPMTFVFAARGIDPKACFKNVTNANHETNAMGVANKQLDAAANNTENLALIEKNQPAAFEKIKIIWKSPLIPSDPLVWSKELSAETKDKIRSFVLAYGTDKTKGDKAEEIKVLSGLEWAPFRASTDDQLLPIRMMEVAKSMAQVTGDAKLSSDEKAAKLKELTEKKAALEAKLASAPQG
ncbi:MULTISPECIES: phosphonate ABC transporter substrate-binding protein [unclassified Aureimonas]|uniref:phosphonate ABC transporter substrate-binding protein n=1 Tax=unclassified Aureimonas TaxID=2615206 RepID=UPI0007016EB7|nr:MULTISPECIES: phosphonate ABC transporter substrate-binding protein [unclassified Aureimonas]KQT65975.1 phosphonate ABC transporter substrate-binding protein [Aureimonas sp. Leaf427]KQT73334.1 phosphonate ABC transporter substrate-binding protein [Aureimonas sp. Leaf460]